MSFDAPTNRLARKTAKASDLARVFNGQLGSAPSGVDDALAGFAVGHIWKQRGDRRIWRARRVTPGLGVWQADDISRPPAGSVLAPYAVVGARRVIPTYTGPAFRTVRASDSTFLDIPFLPDNKPDYALYDAFVAGTTDGISIVYDQTGAGNHWTQTVAANRPTLAPFFNMGDARGIVCSGWDASATQQWFDIPATLTLTANSMSVVNLSMAYHSSRTVPIMRFEHGGANTKPVEFLFQRTSGADALCVSAPNSSAAQQRRVLPGYKPPMTPVVTGFACRSASITMYGGDRASATAGGTSGGVGALALAGGKYGVASGSLVNVDTISFWGGVVMGAVLIYNSTITDAQYAAVMEALHADYDLPMQRRGNIVCDGDSITEYPSAPFYQQRSRLMVPKLSRAANVYNVGTSGAGFGNQTTSLPQWSALYDATAPFNQVYLHLGTNDLFAGTSAAAIFVLFQAYLTALRASNPGWGIIAATALPRTNLSTDGQAQRLLWNDMLRANAGPLGYTLSDLANDPAWATYDAALYDDGTHPNALGRSYLAQQDADSVNLVI